MRDSGVFEKGKKQGKWEFYDFYGVKIKEQEFVDGRPEGKWTSYFQNGSKSGEGEYKNNRKEGKWTYWDKDGKVIYKVIFSNGTEEKVLVNAGTEKK